MDTSYFQRFKNEQAKKAPWLNEDKAAGIDTKSLLKDTKAMKARQAKLKNDMTAWISELESDVKALEKGVSAQALAVINSLGNLGGKSKRGDEVSDQIWASNLFVRREHLRAASAGSPAPKPAVTPVPVASAPAPVAQPAPATKVTAEGLGRTVNALMTSPDPAVRGPITAGLQQSIEASKRVMTGAEFLKLSHESRNAFLRAGGKLTRVEAQANTSAQDVASKTKPTLINGQATTGEVDFSFVPFPQKRAMQEEFDANRGLTPDTWLAWMRHRTDFFRSVGNTSEAMTGREVILPGVVLESVTEAAARERMWASADKYFTDKIASLEGELAIQIATDPATNGNRNYNIIRIEKGLASTKEMQAKQKAKREAEHAADLKKVQERFESLRKVLF